eukprot:g4192.t1
MLFTFSLATLFIVNVFAGVCVNKENGDCCINPPDGKCPLWPTQFAAPFGLHSTVPSIKNGTSMFYYKFLENGTQAQLVDYKDHCFPFTSIRNFASAKPCKLYFIGGNPKVPTGIYLSQPSRKIDCCLFTSGVGAVPPAFLKAYTYKGTNITQPDYYGNQISTEEWDGPENFKYWTVSHYDAIYKNWGHDIVFQDGPTGVTWRWGNFDVSDQDDTIFALPGAQSECSKSCSKFLAEEEITALSEHVFRSPLLSKRIH